MMFSTEISLQFVRGAHPEYLPRPNGTDRQLCYTNTALIQQVVHDAAIILTARTKGKHWQWVIIFYSPMITATGVNVIDVLLSSKKVKTESSETIQ